MGSVHPPAEVRVPPYVYLNCVGRSGSVSTTTSVPMFVIVIARQYAVGLISPPLGMAVGVLSANGVSDNPYGPTGPYHNITQTFTWTEDNLCEQGG